MIRKEISLIIIVIKIEKLFMSGNNLFFLVVVRIFFFVKFNVAYNMLLTAIVLLD